MSKKAYDKVTLILVTMQFILTIVGICIVLGGVIILPFNKVINKREVTITVTDKGIKNQSSSGKYLIYGKDEEGKPVVLEITDSVFMLRFDSSDLYANIEIGKTYRCTTRGYRIKIFSIYPNLYNIEEKG